MKFLAKAPGSSSHEETNVPIHVLHLHALYENLLQFVFPLVSELPRRNSKSHFSSSTHTVDISNVSVPQFWSIRKYLQEASEIATTHYPETLGKAFVGIPSSKSGPPVFKKLVLLDIKVLGGPAFFKSVWETIIQWFDPETRSKTFVLFPSESKPFLSHIAASDLPKEYGGELEWKWQDQPIFDQSTSHLVDEVYQKSDREVFSKGPLICQDGCIRLVGSVGGLPRRDAFCRLEILPH